MTAATQPGSAPAQVRHLSESSGRDVPHAPVVLADASVASLENGHA